jgi:aminoglycoside phosphotransferase (APT) family kinase protein
VLEDLDHAVLGDWLADHLDGVTAVHVDRTELPDGGFSGETTILQVSVVRHGDESTERYVLRREPSEAAVYPAQAPGLNVEVDVQWRVMHAVRDHGGLPVAPTVGYEPDPAFLGVPFFVTGFVVGDVPRETPAYPAEGFYADATPERRRAMNLVGARTVAAVNRMDWRAAGLDFLVPDGAVPDNHRQLGLWRSWSDGQLRGRAHPVLEEAWSLLAATVRPGDEPVVCWGDCRLGNVFWDGAQPVCLTDFEGATIAPAGFDLGWFLMFDRWIHEACGNPRLDGEPSRTELVEAHEEALGRPVADLDWHEVFAAARYCAIVVRVINRMEERGQLSAGTDTYLAGGVTDCLRLLLEEGRL